MTYRGLGVVLALVFVLAMIEPVAAAGPAISLTVVGGGGELSDGSTFSVQALSLSVAVPAHPVVVQKGHLVLDGVRTACTIDSVTSCTEVTLSCGGTPHDVVAGVPGGSHGSIDGVEVSQGFIFMMCFGR